MIDTVLDAIGGYHSDPALSRWDSGSCWENEGQFLYRTVREMQPEVIVEIGRFQGCSTSHLALGCRHNGHGLVYSVDIDANAGQVIDEYLKTGIEFINADALILEWDHEKMPIDLLLEDGSHAPGFTAHVLRNFHARRVIVHDFRHKGVPNVREEAVAVLGPPDEEFFEPPSDCGYGIWHVKP